MKANAYHLFVFFFLVYFASCIEEELSQNDLEVIRSERNYPLADPELWSHFRAFEDEAAARGFQVDLAAANIIGEIHEIEENNIAGLCSYGGRQARRNVVIDKNFWDRANHLYREYIVFHELGHCYLFRDHHEACFANGTYVSLMRSGNGDCRDNYRNSTRSYYIDELLTALETP